jgi:hypothetical protein
VRHDFDLHTNVASGSLYSSVGIVTKLMAGEPRYRFQIPEKDNSFFSSPKAFRQFLGQTQPITEWEEGFYPEIKRPGCEADTGLHLVPSLRTNDLKLHASLRFNGLDTDKFTFTSLLACAIEMSHTTISYTCARVTRFIQNTTYPTHFL